MILPEEAWATVDETAAALKRAPKTIRNLVSKHQLPRRLIFVGRQRRRRIMILSYATRRELERLCWGSPAKPPPR